MNNTFQASEHELVNDLMGEARKIYNKKILSAVQIEQQVDLRRNAWNPRAKYPDVFS